MNGVIFNDGDSVLISSIGPQPANRSDPGSTLVCVTTNVNTACCRKGDNPAHVNTATAGAVGEWRYPNDSLVPCPSDNVVDFVRFGYTHQVRLGREVSTFTPPLGEYTCEVPSPSGVSVNATISLTEQQGNNL